MSTPPFLEHAARGAALGALVGGGIAAVGWFVRQRNDVVVDLGTPAPHLLSGYRALAETLLHFKEVAHHSTTTQALFAQMVQDCEFVAKHDTAKGAMQLTVQKRITQTTTCARRLAHEAFRHRDSHAHDCRMQVEALEAHLGAIQKNMMIG